MSHLDVLGEFSWEKVCEAMEYNNAVVFTDEDIEYFKLCAAGGGNPSKVFWEEELRKRKPDVDIGSLSEIANELKRADIVEELSTYPADDSLFANDKKNLFNKLIKLTSSFDNGWGRFAAKCEFSFDEILKIEARVRDFGQKSPTKAMIQKLRQKFPEMTIKHLESEFRRLDFILVANVLKENVSDDQSFQRLFECEGIIIYILVFGYKVTVSISFLSAFTNTIYDFPCYLDRLRVP